MGDLKMSEIMKKMELVNEPGIRNEKVFKEQKTAALSNEKNSLSNAIMAYDKMTGKDRLEESNAKLEGALTVMKEIFESQDPADEKISKIKQLLTHL